MNLNAVKTIDAETEKRRNALSLLLFCNVEDLALLQDACYNYEAEHAQKGLRKSSDFSHEFSAVGKECKEALTRLKSNGVQVTFCAGEDGSDHRNGLQIIATHQFSDRIFYPRELTDQHHNQVVRNKQHYTYTVDGSI